MNLSRLNCFSFSPMTVHDGPAMEGCLNVFELVMYPLVESRDGLTDYTALWPRATELAVELAQHSCEWIPNDYK